MIKLDSDIRNFARLQRTEYGKTDDAKFDRLFNKSLDKNFLEIAPFLKKEPMNICDIGCGIAAIDMLICKNHTVNHLTLIDKNGLSPKIYYGFKEEAAFYNDLNIITKLFEDNNVLMPATSFIDINTQPLEYKYSYDVIISLLSLSFHYPFKTYADFIKNTIKPNGVLILDIRNDTKELPTILEYFKKYQILSESFKSKKLLFYNDSI
jgi:SAM-dependent methyltransferase